MCFDDENITTCCSNYYRKDDQCICPNNHKHIVNEVQAISNPYHGKGGSDQVFLKMDEWSQEPTQEDHSMHYVGNMYCHSISLQIQHVSSKHSSLHNMYDKWNQ